MILEQRFRETDEKRKQETGSDFKDFKEKDNYGKEVMDEDYRDFSFNKHYMKLLRGAQVSLRELEAYQKDGDVSALNDLAENREDHGQQTKSWSILQWLGLKKKKQDLDEDAENDEDALEYPDSDEEGKDNVKVYTADEVQEHLTLMPWKKKETNENNSQLDESAKSWQKFKGKVTGVVESSWFEYFIMLVVIASTIAAMISFSSSGLEYNLSLMFLGIFLLEMFMKMTAYGLVGPYSYFRNGWNRLDFTLVLLQIFDVAENTYHFVFAENDPNANILKGFRALRVARLLSR